MKRISFKDLNELNRILNKYSKEERKELLDSINIKLDKSYNDLQNKNWTITTANNNPIFNLHKEQE